MDNNKMSDGWAGVLAAAIVLLVPNSAIVVVPVYFWHLFFRK
jgi:hypothetical protein